MATYRYLPQCTGVYRIEVKRICNKDFECRILGTKEEFTENLDVAGEDLSHGRWTFYKEDFIKEIAPPF